MSNPSNKKNRKAPAIAPSNTGLSKLPHFEDVYVATTSALAEVDVGVGDDFDALTECPSHAFQIDFLIQFDPGGCPLSFPCEL